MPLTQVLCFIIVGEMMCTVYWYYQPDDENLLEVSTCLLFFCFVWTVPGILITAFQSIFVPGYIG